MKDIIIKTSRQKTEIATFLSCYIIANLMNAAAIITYNTEWKELYTQQPWLLLITLLLYLLSITLRIAYHYAKKITTK